MNDNDFDTDRIDDAVLALLWRNTFKDRFGHRAWKSFDWDAMNRLHAKGMIGDPHGRAKSVVVTDAGLERSRVLFAQMFGQVDSQATAQKPRRKQAAAAAATTVHRFKLTLHHIAPPIWRSIEIASDASFWDLHCAINDAMGWEDAHLHVFEFGRRRDATLIGMPLDDDDFGFDGPPVLAGWEQPLATRFARKGSRGLYRYDFGDDWTHDIVCEGIFPSELDARYPRCLAGARVCPPEDCGGVPGYENLCAAMRDSKHPERAEFIEWLGGRYDPEAFDPMQVKFTDAGKRLKQLLRRSR